MDPGRWLRWFSPSSHLVPWWHWAWASLCQKLPWWQLCFWLSCRLGEATCIGYVGSLSGTLCKNQGARFLTRRYTERTSFIFWGVLYVWLWTALNRRFSTFYIRLRVTRPVTSATARVTGGQHRRADGSKVIRGGEKTCPMAAIPEEPLPFVHEGCNCSPTYERFLGTVC